ncbi:hypothetical protein VTL71DRAFT_4666 [Oculimacula yallundae]|uniref:Zn(2)-C6 fungal-type domain-containing protein n=1 Tax=Oculimacula yallundae TaxID=86028 RepID=A0ABR4C3S7_9HELO
MPPRRSHRKSHNGCLQCKRRHVKCDEQRPTCSPCQKRELVCHFQPLSGYDTHAQGGSPSQIPSHHQDRSHSHGHGHNALPARTLELRLLHHFITTAYTTFFPRDANHVHVWTIHVPNMALSTAPDQPFLLDSLLAISALHLAHLENMTSVTGAKKSWLQTALRYQDLTLAGLNKALSSFSPENCEAVAVASIFVLLLSIAIPGVCGDEEDVGSGEERSPLVDLMGLRKLIKGMEIVYAQSEVVLTNGVLKDFFLPMFDPHTVAPRAVTAGAEEIAFAEGQKLCPQILTSLARLRTAISLRTDTTSPADLLDACTLLTEIISPLTTLSHGPAINWPYKISASIFTLLEESDPLACLLFLHYGVVLHIFSYWWFTRNAGRRLVRALLPYWKGVDGDKRLNGESGNGNGNGELDRSGGRGGSVGGELDKVGEWRECVEWAKRVVGVVS